MKPEMNTTKDRDADAEVAKALTKLREARDIFGELPTRDLPFPAAVSHVQEHQLDEARLRRYGHQVISNRCYHFAMLTTVKAYHNIQMYLDGSQAGNPLALPLAARTQIELFAVAWHVYDVITSNAGFTKPNLAQRMSRVDEALITAIYGTRSEAVLQFYTETSPSRLRGTTARDCETFKAKNILTRIEKTESGSAYKCCAQDYDRLSEFVHPNGSQNLLFMLKSPNDQRCFRLGLSDPEYIRRAQHHTAPAMVNASSEILNLIVGVPDPFCEAPSTTTLLA